MVAGVPHAESTFFATAPRMWSMYEAQVPIKKFVRTHYCETKATGRVSPTLTLTVPGPVRVLVAQGEITDRRE